MSFSLEQLSPPDWATLSQNAHLVAFGDHRPSDMDRIDYALWVHDDRKPCAFATVIEVDKDTAYMQHGGAFPGTEKSPYAVRTYMMMMNWLKERYSTISTQTRNYNLPMLKLALAAGFLVSGTELNEGVLFVKLLWKK